MYYDHDKDDVEGDRRRTSEGESRHKLERARGHNTRLLILVLLNKADRCLTSGEIRTRLPGPRRPHRTIDYHLKVLVIDGLVQQCSGEPPSCFETK